MSSRQFAQERVVQRRPRASTSYACLFMLQRARATCPARTATRAVKCVALFKERRVHISAVVASVECRLCSKRGATATTRNESRLEPPPASLFSPGLAPVITRSRRAFRLLTCRVSVTTPYKPRHAPCPRLSAELDTLVSELPPGASVAAAAPARPVRSYTNVPEREF